MEADSSYVLDGYPYMHDIRNDSFFAPLLYDDPFVFSYVSGARVCEKNKRWHHLTLDPFLGLLFNGDAEEPSPTPSKHRLSQGASIGIGVGVAAVVIVIAVLVILSIQVPAVKHFFRPFSKRTDQRLTTYKKPDGDGTPRGSWTAAVKPAGQKAE